MLNLAVVTYPAENLGLQPRMWLWPQPRGTVRAKSRFAEAPHRAWCPSPLSQVTSILSPPHSHFQAHGWFLAGWGRERSGDRGEWKWKAAEAAVCTGCVCPYGVYTVLQTFKAFILVLHRLAELKGPEFNKSNLLIWLRRKLRCEERKEERRKHLLRVYHLLWIHSPRYHISECRVGTAQHLNEKFHPTHVFACYLRIHNTHRKGLDI